jgi:ABC-type transport system involved in multi-copper enzyme maturation permease subunit
MNNPVLHKELFMRLRLAQLPLAIRLALLAIGAILLGVIYYFVIVIWVMKDPGKNAGFDAWTWMVGIQAALICLLAPVVAANSITQEKEQQTWEMLIFTRLLPSEIILGKLMARTALLALLLLLFVPIEMFCWHKSPQLITGTMMLLTYATMLVTAVFFATIGLYLSWLLNRTIYAIMSAYSVVIGGLVVGTSLVAFMLELLLSEDVSSKCPLMWVNPVMMMFEAMTPKDTPNTILFLVYGLIVYLILTMLIIWRMTVGFRRFAYSR